MFPSTNHESRITNHAAPGAARLQHRHGDFPDRGAVAARRVHRIGNGIAAREPGARHPGRARVPGRAGRHGMGRLPGARSQQRPESGHCVRAGYAGLSRGATTPPGTCRLLSPFTVNVTGARPRPRRKGTARSGSMKSSPLRATRRPCPNAAPAAGYIERQLTATLSKVPGPDGGGAALRMRLR